MMDMLSQNTLQIFTFSLEWSSFSLCFFTYYLRLIKNLPIYPSFSTFFCGVNEGFSIDKTVSFLYWLAINSVILIFFFFLPLNPIVLSFDSCVVSFRCQFLCAIKTILVYLPIWTFMSCAWITCVIVIIMYSVLSTIVIYQLFQ